MVIKEGTKDSFTIGSINSEMKVWNMASLFHQGELVYQNKCSIDNLQI